MKRVALLCVVIMAVMLSSCKQVTDQTESVNTSQPQPQSKSKSSSKEITAFSFTDAANNALAADVAGTISGTSISLSVPNGTEVNALVATFTVSSGASVKVGETAQTSGSTANDFTNAVTYKVTAEDGSVQNYTVTVKILDPDSYGVTYNLNGGIWAESYNAPTSYKVADGLTLPDAANIARTGYTFGGWYGNVGLSGTEETQIASGATEAKTYWAKWTAKTYTITLDKNGGSTDGSVTAIYNTVLPAFTELTRSGYTLNGYYTATSSGTKIINADGTLVANASGYTNADGKWIKDSSATLYAQWADATPPANVTYLTAASGNAKVTLKWTNPSDTDFAKAVVTWATTAAPGTQLGTADVTGTASSAGTKEITGLTNGTSYTFTVKTVDSTGNASSGVSINWCAGNGGLIGTPTGTAQGGTYSSGITINSTSYGKTSEVVIIPAGTTAQISMTDDSAWSTYNSGSNSGYKGVFLNGRNVTLSPFVMGQYEVTQELYTAVMGSNPSSFTSSPATGEAQEKRPVELITWYQAIAFCNELTKKTMAESDCVYYSDSSFTSVYTIGNASSDTLPYVNTSKKGYRLPTEAEWEYAARGGNPNAAAWKYAYAGSQTAKLPANFTSSPYTDDALENYAWYSNNASNKTHEVGKKTANTLGLYDMSGNVWEWCWDWFGTVTASETVSNPLGASSDSGRVLRGGSWNIISYYCAVSVRGSITPSRSSNNFLGFRLCRSAQ